MDWAYVGRVAVAGGERGLWVFVMVLAHSRAMWGEFVTEVALLDRGHSLVRGARGVAACFLFGGTTLRVLGALAVVGVGIRSVITIRVLQRRAYGLRDEEYLRLKILTACCHRYERCLDATHSITRRAVKIKPPFQERPTP